MPSYERLLVMSEDGAGVGAADAISAAERRARECRWDSNLTGGALSTCLLGRCLTQASKVDALPRLLTDMLSWAARRTL